MGIICGVLLFFIRIPVLSLYQLSPETREMANTFLIILSVVMVGMSYQMPTNGGIIRGSGSIAYSMKVDLISTWAIVIPLSMFMAFVVKASPAIVVCCLNADQIFESVNAHSKIQALSYKRAFSSAGSEHLPYKQRVGGSNPSTPTFGFYLFVGSCK